MAQTFCRIAVCLALLVAGVWPATTFSQTAAQQPDASSDPNRRAAIRFLTESEFPPFNYYDEEGVLTGFNVDLARALCLEVGATCDIQVRPWEELLVTMNRGEADAVIAGHTPSARLMKVVDFTDSYFSMPARFAARRDSGKLDITPEELDGRRIAVAKGTAHEAYLRAFFRYSTVQAYENPELARDALMTNNADLVFDDGVSLAFWVAGTLSRDCCELKGGPFHEPRYFGDGLAIAVPKRDPALKGLLNRALKRVRASGRFEELVLRYFPNRVY
jgi:polar amino acid transport system substrate-binding protein